MENTIAMLYVIGLLAVGGLFSLVIGGLWEKVRG